MTQRIGIAANSIIINGFPFDPRGVAEVERTRDLTNRKPQAVGWGYVVKKMGRDSDGAYRMFDRLDGKS